MTNSGVLANRGVSCCRLAAGHMMPCRGVQLAAAGRHSRESYNSPALFFSAGLMFSLGGKEGQTTALSIKKSQKGKRGRLSLARLCCTLAKIVPS